MADLGPRTASALVLAVLGLGAIWLGGWWFAGLVGLLVAGMIWELQRLCLPEAPGAIAALQALTAAAAVVVFTAFMPPLAALGFLTAALALLVMKAGHDRLIFGLYAGLVLLAGHALSLLQAGAGAGWVLWLIAVVVASDAAGYFVGRSLGGPKFWPRMSPKKTWSGTAGGWVAAAVVGALAAWALAAPVGSMVLLSVLAAMAGQAGDIAESALKRRAGVKDSSALIPGHGGVMDRFDAMAGAAGFAYVAAVLTGLPPVFGAAAGG
jgi:phosphatidate cytidylyltransferase